MYITTEIDEKDLLQQLIDHSGETYILYEMAKNNGHIDPHGFAQTAMKMLIAGCPKDENI